MRKSIGQMIDERIPVFSKPIDEALRTVRTLSREVPVQSEGWLILQGVSAYLCREGDKA